jgi:tetratricopeptide (TPR) repeat protein
LACGWAVAENPANSGRTLVVFPFDNASSAPGLEWIGDAFPELLAQRLSSPTLYVVGRDERRMAYDRSGIPADVHPSRASLHRIAEQLDCDFAVLGQFTYDGSTFSSTAQLLDMRKEKLLPKIAVSGQLVDLINLQTGLAWDLLHTLRPDISITRESFIAAAEPIRLDAFENYVRGTIANTPRDQIAHFRDAVKINPSYLEPWLALGKTLYAERQYEQAAVALGHIPEASPMAQEARFYIGLASYYRGDYAKSEAAFKAVVERLPLPEVYNNLGVASSRQGKRDAVAYFQRAAQDDPNDADYRFNLAVELYRTGDVSGAVRQLREALNQRPGDAEAKAFFDKLGGDSASPTQVGASSVGKPPLERIKRNYDENTFRQMEMQLQAAAEVKLAKTDPRAHARFHVSHGDELLAQGFVTEAEREYREAISLDPSNAQAHAGLARVLENNGDANGAWAEAEAALRLRQFADPLLVMARLDLRDNKTEAASESVDRALQLEPSNGSAQALKRVVAAKLAEKAQPLPKP